MKRDIDLVRTILLAIEEDDCATGHGFIRLNISGCPQEKVSYHVELLYEAGLVDAVNSSTLNNYQWFPKRLTWEGHEFLDSARNKNLWEQAKKELEKIGNFSFEVLKQILINLATRNF